MNDRFTVAVYGAAGHTGRFVTAELERRGVEVVRIGRDAARLAQTGASDGGVWRVAQLDDAAQLDAALRGTQAVINCAGPFLDTALPIVDAALRARIPYLDVTAEQPALQMLVEQRDRAARDANVALVPAAAFYGGLADLLASAVADPHAPIERVDVAVGLDSWHPTRGTRLTGARNHAQRLIQTSGTLAPVPQPVPAGVWAFPAPLGRLDVVMLPFTEVIAMARHLQVESIESWLAELALRDIRNPDTPPPRANDEHGRSVQRFVLDVVVAQHGATHRASATGRDIYAITAPIIVEAVVRLLRGEGAVRGGVTSLGALFDAREFLAALDTLSVSYNMVTSALLTPRTMHASA